MDYCIKGQWVTEVAGEHHRTGLIDSIVKRRTKDMDGFVIVRFGSGGPFEKRAMSELREAFRSEIKEKEGT